MQQLIRVLATARTESGRSRLSSSLPLISMPKGARSGSGSSGYSPYSRSGVYTASGTAVRNPAAYAATGAPTYTAAGRSISNAAAYSNAVTASRGGGTGTKVYHGTSKVAADAIMDSGFRPSSDGMLGPGLYVTTDRSKAVAFAKASGDEGRVIVGRAQFGKTAMVDARDARKGHYSETSWQSSHDAAYVPRGEGVARPEHCVKDPARVKPLYPTKVWRGE